MRTTKTNSAYWGKGRNGMYHKFAINQAQDVSACNCSKILQSGTMVFTDRLPKDAKICKTCAKHHTFPPLKTK
jgi:hypothetical protein